MWVIESAEDRLAICELIGLVRIGANTGVCTGARDGCSGKRRGTGGPRAAATVEQRAEAGDRRGGVCAWRCGARCGAPSRRDIEFDLPLAAGFAGGGERLCAGAGSTGG